MGQSLNITSVFLATSSLPHSNTKFYPIWFFHFLFTKYIRVAMWWGAGHSQQGKNSFCVMCITVTGSIDVGHTCILNSSSSRNCRVWLAGWGIWTDKGEGDQGTWHCKTSWQQVEKFSTRKASRSRPYSVWGGGRLSQKEGQRLCKRSRSSPLE